MSEQSRAGMSPRREPWDDRHLARTEQDESSALFLGNMSGSKARRVQGVRGSCDRVRFWCFVFYMEGTQ